jgi:hypothetical protein
VKIGVFYHLEDTYAAEIVCAAAVRSFSAAQVSKQLWEKADHFPMGIVLINPRETDRKKLEKLFHGGRKVLVLGKLNEVIAEEIGLSCGPLPPTAASWGEIIAGPDGKYDHSAASISYEGNNSLLRYLVLIPRYLARFDFLNEWNNLGFGRISLDQELWSISQKVKTVGATPVGIVRNGSCDELTMYAAVNDFPGSSILWFNRPVGPVDSVEWHLVERFFSEYRSGDLCCFPYISEIPFGYEGAVTMRLDCDQAIASALPLFDLYQKHEVPFSLAVLTGLEMKREDKDLLSRVITSGGSLLSHSNSHYPNWGNNYETALREALISKKWLEENIPSSAPVKYAVSPFHQNPLFAIKALADAGYSGFIAGIIHNDPESLLGRSGQVPFLDKRIVTHSQQCMLHGDCYHRYGNNIDPYKKSFESHLKAESIFGYLDHPFSSQYAYGWSTEEERLAAHAEVIAYVKAHQNIWLCNLNDCLDFIVKKSKIGVKVNLSTGAIEAEGLLDESLPSICVQYKGRSFSIGDLIR